MSVCLCLFIVCLFCWVRGPALCLHRPLQCSLYIRYFSAPWVSPYLDHHFSKGRRVWVFLLLVVAKPVPEVLAGFLWSMSLTPLCSMDSWEDTSLRKLSENVAFPHWILLSVLPIWVWGLWNLEGLGVAASPCSVLPNPSCLSSSFHPGSLWGASESLRDPERASRWDGSLFLSPIDLSCSETIIILVWNGSSQCRSLLVSLANGYPANCSKPHRPRKPK